MIFHLIFLKLNWIATNHSKKCITIPNYDYGTENNPDYGVYNYDIITITITITDPFGFSVIFVNIN